MERMREAFLVSGGMQGKNDVFTNVLLWEGLLTMPPSFLQALVVTGLGWRCRVMMAVV